MPDLDIDFRSPRLYVDAPLAAGDRVPLNRNQGNYLGNVLRLGAGTNVLVFNGRDGEWRAAISVRKRPEHLEIVAATRKQDHLPDVRYVFAPLKHARLDYMVQKAVEMGASALQPVLTRFTQVGRVNGDRMLANAIEAAEQCGILRIPAIDPLRSLEAVLEQWPQDKPLIFCDEGATAADPVAELSLVAAGPVGVLVGPEGGFAEVERHRIRALPSAVAISLGPRIMRADTAAVAALALVNAVLGDWRVPR